MLYPRLSERLLSIAMESEKMADGMVESGPTFNLQNPF